jgi:hypothetical protein
LERIISYNKQRHNNSSQSHSTIKHINWRNSAMFSTNNDVYQQLRWNLLKAHIHGAQACPIGYIQTLEVPTLHQGQHRVRCYIPKISLIQSYSFMHEGQQKTKSSTLAKW